MFLPAVGQETAHPTAKGMMKASEIQILLKTARTPAEHQKLADHFTATAEWQERQASEYERLAGGAGTGHGQGHGQAQSGQAAPPAQPGQYTNPAQIAQPIQPAQGAQPRQAGRPAGNNEPMIGHGMGVPSGNLFQSYAKHCREAAAEMRKLAMVHSRMGNSPK